MIVVVIVGLVVAFDNGSDDGNGEGSSLRRLRFGLLEGEEKVGSTEEMRLDGERKHP